MSFKKPYLRRRAERASPPYSRRSPADGSQQYDASAAENDVVTESAGGGGASIGNNLMGTNTTADADDSISNDPNYNPKGDTYEFAAFAAWYLFLILCCVVPTYCAYRRRARAARLEMEQRERRMLTATRGPGGSDWYVEAMAELERRRREDEAHDDAAAAAAGVDRVLTGSLILGTNGPRQGGSSSINNSTDVVLFRGMSSDGRPITVLAGSGTTAMTTSSSLNTATDPSSVTGTRMRASTSSSTDEPMRLVYLRRESSGTDDGAQDGIRTFTGLNFGSNVNPFTSVAGTSWFMAAAQQREQVQREERSRILDAVLENTSMWVNDGDLLTADAEEVGGEGIGANTNDADDPRRNKDSGVTKSRQDDGLDTDVSSSTCKVERDEEGAVDKKDGEEEGLDAIAKEDIDSDFPFLRLRAPLEAIKYDPKDRGRIVPNSCAICLCPYTIEDEVCWSTKGSKCPHAFHKSCIQLWLSKKEEALCPCCRQQFVSVEALLKHLPAVEDEYEQDQDQGQEME